MSGRRNFIGFQDLYVVLIQNHFCFRHQKGEWKISAPRWNSRRAFPGGTFEEVRFHALRGALRNRERWELLSTVGWWLRLRWCHFMRISDDIRMYIYPGLMMIFWWWLMRLGKTCSFFFNSERIPMKKVWGQDVGFAMRWFGFVFFSKKSRRWFSMTNDESSLLKLKLWISGRNLLDIFCSTCFHS